MSEAKWLRKPFRHRLKTGAMVESQAIIHLCSHPGCDKFGPYLVGANWLKDVRGTAYCREHLPANEALTFGRHTAPAQQAETADANQPDGPGNLSPGRDLGT